MPPSTARQRADFFVEATDYTPKPASIANATAFEASLGVDHACIVLPSVYGTNNSVLVDALRKLNGTYRGVAVIDPDEITNTTLEVFHEAGVRGCKLILFLGGSFSTSTVGLCHHADRSTNSPTRQPGSSGVRCNHT